MNNSLNIVVGAAILFGAASCGRTASSGKAAPATPAASPKDGGVSSATTAPTIPTIQAPGANLVRSEIVTRTFAIRVFGDVAHFGTGFLVQVDGREYLVTAAHVVVDLVDAIEIQQSGEWRRIGAALVGSIPLPEADVAVLALERALSPPFNFVLSSEGISATQELFFLGFPNGHATIAPALNNGYPVALIKSAHVAGWVTDGAGKPHGLYLDAMINHGCSGGPVVTGTSPTQIVGIVSQFLPDYVATPDALQNGGLGVSYDITYALNFIKANPTGPLVAK